MSLYLLLLRSLRRPSTPRTLSLSSLPLYNPNPNNPPHLTPAPTRTFSFSSAYERQSRIEPPLNAIRRDSLPPLPRDPNAPRLNLHNRVQSLIHAGDLDAASEVVFHSVFSSTRPTVLNCNAIVAAMYGAKKYNDAITLFHYFFNHSTIVPNIVSYNNLINIYCDEGRVETGLEVI